MVCIINDCCSICRCKNFKQNQNSKTYENIVEILVGSIFLAFSMPLIGMSYIQFYAFNGISGLTIEIFRNSWNDFRNNEYIRIYGMNVSQYCKKENQHYGRISR